MQNLRRVGSLILVISFAILPLPVLAQEVIATVPVGVQPGDAAVNPVTNKTYVTNLCGNDAFCHTHSGTVTVIDGTTFATTTVAVGSSPYGVAVNSVTNKIYVTNQCGNDVSCSTHSGTVTVIDGATLATTTVNVGAKPVVPVINSVTNKIYVPNACGNDPTCQTYSGTVTVIDGVTLATATVSVGARPEGAAAVDSVTNKIYVPNACGNDPTCAQPYVGGTVTVIDGASLSTTTVAVGIYADSADVNSTTNQIYVANKCGSDPTCASVGSVTVIDGATLTTTNVTVQYYPYGVGVNPVTNKIYVTNGCGTQRNCRAQGTETVIDGATLATTNVDVGYSPTIPVVNSVTNKTYLANYCSPPNCLNLTGALTVIDGATLGTSHVSVGRHADAVAVNSVTNRIYVPNLLDNTVSVIDGTSSAALQFVPLAQPCRVVDTRPDHGGGGPIQGGTHEDFLISGGGAPCGIPATAAAYSFNVTVVPQGSLGYLTIWPSGQPQPVVSTLNSLDGRIKANAAIIPAGTNGEVSVYATDTTNVVLDLDGYFVPVSGSTLAFYPLPPCRVADTRRDNFPPGLGSPYLTAGQERAFPILDATACNIPASAAAYSLNFTVVPHRPLGYLTVWPTGGPRPVVSTLNDAPAQIIANAAIVVAGTSGEVSAYPTDDTELVIDINGYFAAAGPGGLSLYGLSPCRVIDTRHVGAGNPFSGTLSPPVDVVGSGCGASSLAQAYVFNASVVPSGALGYLTLWPNDGSQQPVVSTLNAVDGSLSSNMAIVPTSTNGSVNAYANGLTQLILDITGYFAP